MKSILFILSFLPIAVYSQKVTRLDITITNLEDGNQLIINSDSSKFEYFSHCSMDAGFRLKKKLKDGIYEVYTNDTLSYRAYYKNKVKDSVWTYYFPNGKVSGTTTYSAGEKHGPYLRFGEDGTIKQKGSYDHNEMNGIWTEMSSNSTLMHRMTIENGEKVKQEWFYDNGNLKIEEHSKGGKYNGVNVEYYPNGQKKQLSYYTNDKCTRYINYTEDGLLIIDKTLE